MKKLIKLLTVLAISLCFTLPLYGCEGGAEYYYCISPYGGEEHFMVYIGEENSGYSFSQIYFELKQAFDDDGWVIAEEYMEDYIFYAYRPMQYSLRLVEGGEMQYGFFFYSYDLVYANPFIDFIEHYESAIEDFYAKFPELKTKMQRAPIDFYIMTDSPFYRTDSEERTTDLYGRYYHKWRVSYNEVANGQQTIHLRQYRINTDGWYALAIGLAGLFIGIVIATSRKGASY